MRELSRASIISYLNFISQQIVMHLFIDCAEESFGSS